MEAFGYYRSGPIDKRPYFFIGYYCHPIKCALGAYYRLFSFRISVASCWSITKQKFKVKGPLALHAANL